MRLGRDAAPSPTPANEWGCRDNTTPAPERKLLSGPQPKICELSSAPPKNVPGQNRIGEVSEVKWLSHMTPDTLLSGSLRAVD